ncbi:MAG: AAA-like domain-containing protein [Pyrinomonadaceae bacterium]|nr:AAA-like domain-containing protein [Pyrinomonadaceae bacterium]
MSSEDEMMGADSSPSQPAEARRRIFISYKRGGDPDESVAMQVYRALASQHDVFIDQLMPVGTPWAERIEAELRHSNFLISFLSERSVHSEMVLAEVETAHRLRKEGPEGPMILPVRLGYREPFEYPLSAYLNSLNWALWDEPADTVRLINEIRLAISGSILPIGEDQLSQVLQAADPQQLPRPSPSAQPVPLEMPEGTMNAESALYVRRPSDGIAFEAIKREGVTITIKAPRQMGKSSLLMRTINQAAKAGKRVAFLDFQLIDKAMLTDGDLFFKQFCSWLTDALDLEDRVEEFWRGQLPNGVRCTRYLNKYLLKEVNGPLVFAMDEVDSIFEADFRSDFFGMLRSWHNSRQPSALSRYLDLVLVTSTEPYQLIENLNQSPFNVGEVLELDDFDKDQVSRLNQLHSSPLTNKEADDLMTLLHGHPYLVRRALYLVASGRCSPDELFSQATNDRGPFGDHLRYHLFRLHKKAELVEALRRVILKHECEDKLLFFRLRGAGLVRQDGHEVIPRCSLYESYFREQLNVRN